MKFITAALALTLTVQVGCALDEVYLDGEDFAQTDAELAVIDPMAADGVGSLKWNRISWNRISWNRISWNRISWNEISLAEKAWHEMRVGPLVDAPLKDADRDSRWGRALSSADVREVFGYIVECALPPTSAVAYVDINGTAWTFPGLHGLAADWHAASACDESCQRSVSACLIGRVNYYGERNVMSWRRGSGIPLDQNTAGLESPTLDEEQSFNLDEGAVWGNIFLTEPEVYVCRGVDTIAELTLPGIDLGVYGGNVPMGAIRMCAGDTECLDDVYIGSCGGTVNDSICTDRRPNSAYDSCTAPGGSTYTEVMTIRRTDFAIHADFVPGHGLDVDLSTCAATVADARPTCENDHDPVCVGHALNDCAAHSVLETGAALDRHASTCTGYVCALRGECCTTLWDANCVAAASDLCT